MAIQKNTLLQKALESHSNTASAVSAATLAYADTPASQVDALLASLLGNLNAEASELPAATDGALSDLAFQAPEAGEATVLAQSSGGLGQSDRGSAAALPEAPAAPVGGNDRRAAASVVAENKEDEDDDQAWWLLLGLLALGGGGGGGVIDGGGLEKELFDITLLNYGKPQIYTDESAPIPIKVNGQDNDREDFAITLIGKDSNGLLYTLSFSIQYDKDTRLLTLEFNYDNVSESTSYLYESGSFVAFYRDSLETFFETTSISDAGVMLELGLSGATATQGDFTITFPEGEFTIDVNQMSESGSNDNLYNVEVFFSGEFSSEVLILPMPQEFYVSKNYLATDTEIFSDFNINDIFGESYPHLSESGYILLVGGEGNGWDANDDPTDGIQFYAYFEGEYSQINVIGDFNLPSDLVFQV
jgi:hypothetical protein